MLFLLMEGELKTQIVVILIVPDAVSTLVEVVVTSRTQ